MIKKHIKKGMLMYQPALRWEDAIPCGNGTLGAMIYGHIRNDIILLNHDRLYLRGERPKFNPIYQYIPEFRHMLLEGRYKEAEQFFIEKLKENYFGPQRPDPYQPAFDIKIDTDTTSAFTDYKRTLDFETGEATVEWKEKENIFYRRLFVSRADDAVIMEIGTSKSGGINCRLSLDAHDAEAAAGMGSGRELQKEQIPFNYEVCSSNNTIIFKAKYGNGDEFGGAVRIIADGGELKSEENHIRVKAADRLLLIGKLFVYEDSNAALERLEREIEELFTDSYDKLFERHAYMHAELFNRLSLDLIEHDSLLSNEELLLQAYNGEVPTAIIQRLFDYGRYLLISSSSPGSLPANLQGIWNGDYNPAWSSDFHNDENIQMNYWAALPGNLPETILPYFDYYESMLKDYRANSRAVYGCRGILVPIAQTSHGLLYGSSVWTTWTAGAGWLAQLFYDYWLFTGDLDFLKNRAVPFLKEVALFYEDFLIESDDGRLMFIPSLSPENIPSILEGSLVTINATMDVAIAREVLTNLCNACELLGIEQEGVERWRKILAKLPDYDINEDGAIKEWIHPELKDNYHHRHQSHIYPLFPGIEVTEENNPELFKAIKIAVEKRLTVGLTAQTGWSFAHMANIYARLGDGERALECIELLCRSCVGPNLFTYHNDWRSQGITMFWGHGNHPPFQIDANFGLTAAILEMLIFSIPGMIKLLPALPDSWKKGSLKRALCRGAIEVSIEWNRDAGIINAEFFSSIEQSVTVKFPGKPQKIICQSEQIDIEDSDYGVEYRKIKLPAGRKIALEAHL